MLLSYDASNEPKPGTSTCPYTDNGETYEWEFIRNNAYKDIITIPGFECKMSVT